MHGTLYLVATPIGNLADITLRAVEVLKNADLIACEDTRHSKKLLTHLGISNRLISLHEHNEEKRAHELIGLLAGGKNIALVSDAGTPAISDPGALLVKKAADAGIAIVPVPGPAAFVAAVTVSGLPTDSVYFGGFLPSKKNERRKRLLQAGAVPATLVFYESPHRLTASLRDCLEVLGDRRAAAARELTKLHEEVVRGPLSELASKFSDASAKGEFVLVIDRARENAAPAGSADLLPARVRELERSGMEPKAALKTAAREFGISRSEAYRRLQAGPR